MNNEKTVIISAGDEANSLAQAFRGYKEYKFLRGYSLGRQGKNIVHLGIKLEPEEIEQLILTKDKSLDIFSKQYNNEESNIFFFVDGSDFASAVSLKVLEKFQLAKIYVFYIRNSFMVLDEIKRKHERVVYNVLQQYARSGLFQKMYLFDYKKSETILGQLATLSALKEAIYNSLAKVIHMTFSIRKFETPLLGSSMTPPNPARLVSLGIVDPESGAETLFFDIEKVSCRLYYYLADPKKIDEEVGFITKVREFFANKKSNVVVEYDIFRSPFDHDYVITESYSEDIQL